MPVVIKLTITCDICKVPQVKEINVKDGSPERRALAVMDVDSLLEHSTTDKKYVCGECWEKHYRESATRKEELRDKSNDDNEFEIRMDDEQTTTN